MRYVITFLALLAVALALAGCASVTTGTSQAVAVDTAPERGAACDLANDKGNWQLASTPGTVTVARSYSALTVTCRKDGAGLGVATVQSGTKGAAFGNIIAGGLIGAAVDMSSGAAYDYPPSVLVTLTRQP
jgi:uncharacterized protein YceK